MGVRKSAAGFPIRLLLAAFLAACSTGRVAGPVKAALHPIAKAVASLGLGGLGYSVTDPYFEMTGARIEPGQHTYIIKILVQRATANYPRGGAGMLTVPVWRNRNHLWCWTQTLLVPIGGAAASTFTLDTKQYREGDTLMFEDWHAASWQIYRDGELVAAYLIGRTLASEPGHRDQIHADCTN